MKKICEKNEQHKLSEAVSKSSPRGRIYLRMYMRQNLGDDLFLTYLMRRYPHIPFYLYAKKSYQINYRTYRNLVVKRPLHICAYGKLLQRFSYIMKREPEKTAQSYLASRADATLILGGSMFMEPVKQSLQNDLRKKGLPFFILGVNFGPYESEDYLAYTRKYLHGKTDICFRDKTSYKLFQDNPAVRVETDILFGLEPTWFQRKNSKNGGTFVSVIDLTDRWMKGLYGLSPEDRKTLTKRVRGRNMGEVLEGKLTSHILDLLREGREVTLASFCDKGGDYLALVRILKRIEKEEEIHFSNWRKTQKLKVLRYRGKESQRRRILHEIGRAERVIGGRYHSIVLGLLAGKKVWPFCYNVKAENLLKDLGLEERAVHLFQISDNTSFGDEEDIQLTKEKLADLRKSAERQFERLDLYIGEHFKGQ